MAHTRNNQRYHYTQIKLFSFFSFLSRPFTPSFSNLPPFNELLMNRIIQTASDIVRDQREVFREIGARQKMHSSKYVH